VGGRSISGRRSPADRRLSHSEIFLFETLFFRPAALLSSLFLESIQRSVRDERAKRSICFLGLRSGGAKKFGGVGAGPVGSCPTFLRKIPKTFFLRSTPKCRSKSASQKGESNQRQRIGKNVA
jgi:hypothetical protein